MEGNETLYPHEKIMRDYGVKLKELPMGLRKKVAKFDNEFGEYLPEATSKQGQEVMKISFELASEIEGLDQGLWVEEQEEVLPEDEQFFENLLGEGIDKKTVSMSVFKTSGLRVNPNGSFHTTSHNRFHYQRKNLFTTEVEVRRVKANKAN